MSGSVVYFVIRLALAAILLWAALAKLRSFRSFVSAIREYGLVASRVTPLAATIVVVAEVTVAGLLISGVPWSSVAAVVLFGGFTGILMLTLIRGKRVACHCFGPATEQISWFSALRAAILFTMAIAAFGLDGSVSAMPQLDTAVPALTIAAGIVVGIRTLGLAPAAWTSLRTQAILTPIPTRKVSFRYYPLDRPLSALTAEAAANTDGNASSGAVERT